MMKTLILSLIVVALLVLIPVFAEKKAIDASVAETVKQHLLKHGALGGGQ